MPVVYSDRLLRTAEASLANLPPRRWGKSVSGGLELGLQVVATSAKRPKWLMRLRPYV